MLGVFSPREPIAPEFSKEVRESLRRAHTGQLTERERAAHRRLKRSEQYWKYLQDSEKHSNVCNVKKVIRKKDETCLIIQ